MDYPAMAKRVAEQAVNRMSYELERELRSAYESGQYDERQAICKRLSEIKDTAIGKVVAELLKREREY